MEEFADRASESHATSVERRDAHSTGAESVKQLEGKLKDRLKGLFGR